MGTRNKPLSECLEEVETPVGRARLKAYLESLPFPHFEGCPGNRRLLVRIDEDGTRTVGRFVGRTFCPEKVADANQDAP